MMILLEGCCGSIGGIVVANGEGEVRLEQGHRGGFLSRSIMKLLLTDQRVAQSHQIRKQPRSPQNMKIVAVCKYLLGPPPSSQYICLHVTSAF